jgi:translation initiation factor 2 alpha subunit (eIF-2alpha)
MNLLKNIELVLKKVEFEISNNTPATKTLMNTYGNIFNQFKFSFNCKDEDQLATLYSHKKRFDTLLIKSYELTSHYLESGEYKNADNMVLIGERMDNLLYHIRSLINEQKRFENLPQNKN